MTAGSIAAPRPGARGRKPARREILLAEAAQQINDRGAGSVALAEIGEAVGLSRNALYYYVRDRDDLVFQSYVRACRLAAADLDAAAAEPDAEAAIRSFVALTLSIDRPKAAVLCDVDILDPARRDEVRRLESLNTEALRTLFRRGVGEGAFRAHDDEVAAQSLTGMLSWMRLSPAWMKGREAAAERERAGRTFCAILFDGLATSAGRAAPRPVDLNALMFRPFDAFDRRQAGEMKMQQLVAAASRLFNRKGVDGTSLDEIGLAVGATKGAVYHYFTDKTELVIRCYQRSVELHEIFQGAAYALDAPPSHRIAALLDMACQAQGGPWSPMMPHPGFLALPLRLRADITRRMVRFTESWAREVDAGVAQGDCRDVDRTYSPVAMAGVYRWLTQWWTPDHRLPLAELSMETVRLLMHGVRREPETR